MEYFADIDTALAIIQQEGHDSIQINAHSTGGLIALSYAQAQSQKANNHLYKLVLNSPFVDMNQSPFNEKIAIPMVSFLGRFFPNLKVPDGVSTLYGESIAKQYHGEWEYNMNWKPLVAFDVNAGWLHAIYQAQKRIQKNYQIKQDILVCCSDHATYEKVWSEKLHKGDAVLSVQDIQVICSQFKSQVKIKIIPGGLHDLALSEKSIRSLYFQSIFE